MKSSFENNENEAIPKRAVDLRLPQKKVASSKPRPVEKEIIEISPDTNEIAAKNKLLKKKTESKKKAPTLTSALTARSKVG